MRCLARSLIFLSVCLALSWSVVSAATHNVRIAWPTALDSDGLVAGYRIYELDHNSVDDIALHPDNAKANLGLVNEFTFVSVPPGEHYYWVSAFDDKGNETLNMQGVSATIGDSPGSPPTWPKSINCQTIRAPYPCCTGPGTGCDVIIEIQTVE